MQAYSDGLGQGPDCQGGELQSQRHSWRIESEYMRLESLPYLRVARGPADPR